MRIIEKITNLVLFKGLIEKINQLIDNSNEMNNKMSFLESLDLSYFENFNDLAETIDDKVDKSSIVDDLSTNDPNKPLSARQGIVLKQLIDTKESVSGKGVSSTTVNDDGYLVITFTDGTVQNAGFVKGEQGEQGDKGDKGEPYTLTEADKLEIADKVLSIIPNGDEVSY
jgi:hypothetical protein